MANFLDKRLAAIRATGTFRSLPGTVRGIDFWSNDYLGLARDASTVSSSEHLAGGATGSRLISGDRDAYHQLEVRIAEYHGFPSALLYPSGYTAFLGLLSSLLQRTDTIIYDELSHACCRDGIRLGHARALRFRHNDLEDLRRQLEGARPDGNVFILTESRFSMDGDRAPLREIALLCQEYGPHLIVDEAHSGGLDGAEGRGIVHALGLQQHVFANVITYGKAFGGHGGAVLGSAALKSYLVNTSRPFIYSTAPAAAQYAAIDTAYATLEESHAQRMQDLADNVDCFQRAIHHYQLSTFSPEVNGPIQIIRCPGNDAVMQLQNALWADNFLVKAIRSPTVAAGQERLRICLHSFNTKEEIERLVQVLGRELATFGGHKH
ncbi:aminotransferase class I/II-fold pyridoxal phosphate-dependent enzyme [Lewinella sp. 4G2]|uniref:aminotransferase class I/II-fold pyridoxal phosphate-dependent enzyme n=1 Tax=Lewinella sp. 4G2 TaxID=1803372 RepID=UPI0007B4C817|nr:aminotransferase class I/II-fold pyridoxal phosphate-dependent enzyme [Lewinella sp. 4G2]